MQKCSRFGQTYYAAGWGQVEGNPVVNAVVTDNRAAGPGSLFVCIRGERADGHDYAAKAVQAGACAVVAQRPVQGVPAGRCVLVKNPLDAMIRMGANYRAGFSPVLVGVTGSVGKTTTKEFCYAVFSAFGKTLKTQGNQNNEIGMPNTLFRLDGATQYAVIEMGMQGLGEIEKLTQAARPCGGHHHMGRPVSSGAAWHARKHSEGEDGDMCRSAGRCAAGGERRQ